MDATLVVDEMCPACVTVPDVRPLATVRSRSEEAGVLHLHDVTLPARWPRRVPSSLAKPGLCSVTARCAGLLNDAPLKASFSWRSVALRQAIIHAGEEAFRNSHSTFHDGLHSDRAPSTDAAVLCCASTVLDVVLMGQYGVPRLPMLLRGPRRRTEFAKKTQGAWAAGYAEWSRTQDEPAPARGVASFLVLGARWQ